MVEGIIASVCRSYYWREENQIGQRDLFRQDDESYHRCYYSLSRGDLCLSSASSLGSCQYPTVARCSWNLHLDDRRQGVKSAHCHGLCDLPSGPTTVQHQQRVVQARGELQNGPNMKRDVPD